MQNTLGVGLKRGRSSTPPWTVVTVHNDEGHDCLVEELGLTPDLGVGLKRGRSSTPPWTVVIVHNDEVHDCLGEELGLTPDLGQRLGGVVTEHLGSRS